MRGKVHVFDKWLTAGLDLLFPIHCAGCGTAGAVWCDECTRQLERIRAPLCRNCGLGLGRLRLCPACQRRKPHLQVRSYARYSGRLISALLHLKYRPNQRLAAQMGSWLAPIVRQENWPASQVVPVPLAKRRKRQRGFNQARLLSERLARRLGTVHRPGKLRRVEETRSQVGLAPSERWNNVRLAFRAEPDSFAGERVLLVDDLMTTGATLSACAHALREAGALQVWGVTVGRA